MAEVRFEYASKLYVGSEEPAVDALDLSIHDGELMVLVGPSGSGKSTALRMLAGLEEVDAGEVWIGDQDVTDDQAKDRDVAMVFQNYALYPYLDVAANLGFPLKMARVKGSERERRVRETAELLDLTPYLARKPSQLSGGQRQRVAMGRAIIREPAVFLMDEPLSNLDAKLRVQMRAEIASLQSRLGVTTVFVTHDQVEAMTLGQRVAVMRDGILQQCDVPQTLFLSPANLFVAAFIGSPSMNLVAARVTGRTVEFGGHSIPLAPGVQMSPREVVLGLRPTDLDVAGPHVDPSWPRVEVAIQSVEQLGAESHAVFALDAERIVTDAVRAAIESEGDDGVLLADDRRARFIACVHGRHGVQPRSRIELAIDHRALHFFDPVSGAALDRGRAVAVPA